MIPGLNPRQMQKAMQRMGIKQVEIDASEVVIKTKNKNLVVKDPHVVKINMSGQESFQISGHVEEESAISDEDVDTVVEQSGVSKEESRKALEKHSGDLASAILELQDN